MDLPLRVFLQNRVLPCSSSMAPTCQAESTRLDLLCHSILLYLLNQRFLRKICSPRSEISAILPTCSVRDPSTGSRAALNEAASPGVPQRVLGAVHGPEVCSAEATIRRLLQSFRAHVVIASFREQAKQPSHCPCQTFLGEKKTFTDAFLSLSEILPNCFCGGRLCG